MKRFYCTICKCVKRVQKLPPGVADPTAEKPELRKGTCRWHTEGRPKPAPQKARTRPTKTVNPPSAKKPTGKKRGS